MEKIHILAIICKPGLLLDLNIRMRKEQNPDIDIHWHIGDNAEVGDLDSLKNVEGITIYPRVPSTPAHFHSTSKHHADALNVII